MVSSADTNTYGHPLPPNAGPGASIFTFQNIGRQTASAYMAKSFQMSHSFASTSASVAMYAEHGLLEACLTRQDRFTDRQHRRSPGSFSYLLNNINAISDTPQAWGGSGLSVTKALMSHKLSHSGDPTGLGGWTVFRFQGQAGHSFSVFSAYRPCFSPAGGNTVWSQQYSYFLDRTAEGSPRPNPLSLFDRDITEDIQQRIDMGNSIILGIDHNSDVCTGPLALLLRRMGLRDSIHALHGSCSAPATQNRNTTRTPIDAIWVLPGVQVL